MSIVPADLDLHQLEVQVCREDCGLKRRYKTASTSAGGLCIVRYRNFKLLSTMFDIGLSQFEPGKINSKLTDFFERKSPRKILFN